MCRRPQVDTTLAMGFREHAQAGAVPAAAAVASLQACLDQVRPMAWHSSASCILKSTCIQHVGLGSQQQVPSLNATAPLPSSPMA